MKIFVTGATGYIGSAVATGFARAGHEVSGLVRSAEKARRLSAAEVRPVVGSLDDPPSFRAAAEESEVLIHCAVEYSARQWELHDRVFALFLESARKTGRPRTIVTTSGVWVYGTTGAVAASEASPLRLPAMVEPRPAFDQRVLDANGGPLRTLVIRPGCVYGERGGLTGSWFESAVSEGAARLVGDGSNRWAMVHVADLADLYVRAVESGAGGELFNATDRSRFTVLDCARAASLAAGTGGRVVSVPAEEAAAAMGAPYVECLLLDQHVDSSKAVRRLGWQPRHGGFADGAGRYFEAWRAAR
ncbi:MAG: NAD-dependent epimerase/dehydratase family protein [Thermoanaerobaculia bacterium]